MRSVIGMPAGYCEPAELSRLALSTHRLRVDERDDRTEQLDDVRVVVVSIAPAVDRRPRNRTDAAIAELSLRREARVCHAENRDTVIERRFTVEERELVGRCFSRRSILLALLDGPADVGCFLLPVEPG